jgi:hypothetical protein
MDQRWRMDVPRMSANEADQVVDLWLRERMSAVNEEPINPRALSIPELAQTLGAREDEVALLLCHIRDRKNSRRLKPAIPVRRSWLIIGAIYGSVFILGAGLFGIGFARGIRSARMGAPFAFRSSRFANYYDRYTTGRAIPEEFGFDYRHTYSPAMAPRPIRVVSADNDTLASFAQATDWVAAQRGLQAAIEDINSQRGVALAQDITDKQIEASLAKGEERGISAITESESITPSEIDRDRLVSWSVFTVTYNDRRISTWMPMAKVADETLEKAVRGNIEKRLERLLKALKSRLSTDEIPSAPIATVPR